MTHERHPTRSMQPTDIIMIISRSQNEKLESIIEKLRNFNGNVGASKKQWHCYSHSPVMH